jgi:hypothetical protein
VISFQGGLSTPWIARPESGTKVFFETPDQLVRFLIDGGLDVVAIRLAIRTVEGGGESMVLLGDPSTT